MEEKLKKRMAQLYLGLFAGILVPGGAYFVRGKYLKGFMICIAVLASFFIGLIITQNYAFTSQTLERHPVMFYLQYLVGAPSIVSNYLTPHIFVTSPFIETKMYEIGVLYIAIAGLLNLLAYIQSISDFFKPSDYRYNIVSTGCIDVWNDNSPLGDINQTTIVFIDRHSVGNGINRA